jgi:oxygen-independent coproporphyrinogen-3 oxidase
LLDAGYVRIGLDHFALPGDSLAIARQDGRLKRNFQGYTDDSADTLIGLGASAIGRMPQGFVQNAVPIRDYLAHIAEDQLATAKGYVFTREDHFRADIIERIMCDLAVDLPRLSRLHGRDHRSAIVDHPRIESLIADGAVTMTGSPSETARNFWCGASRRRSMPILRIPQQRIAAQCEAPARDYFAARDGA